MIRTVGLLIAIIVLSVRLNRVCLILLLVMKSGRRRSWLMFRLIMAAVVVRLWVLISVCRSCRLIRRRVSKAVLARIRRVSVLIIWVAWLLRRALSRSRMSVVRLRRRCRSRLSCLLTCVRMLRVRWVLLSNLSVRLSVSSCRRGILLKRRLVSTWPRRIVF